MHAREPETPRFHAELGLLHPNPWLVALASVPFALVAALLVAALVSGDYAALVFAPHLVLVGALAMAYVLVRRPRPWVTWARVRASREAITVGARTYARRELRAGFTLRDEGRATVRLEPASRLEGRLDLVVADVEEGRALLRILGFDALQTVARFRASSRALERPWLSAAAMIALFVATSFAAGALRSPFLSVFAVLLALGLQLWPSRVDVGADGVLLTWLHTRRFLRAADILHAEIYEEHVGKNRIRGVVVSLRAGEPLRIPVSSPTWDAGRSSVLAERINAVAVAHRASAPAPDAALLSRDGLDAKRWLERLRGIGAGASATLRTAPVRADDLWRVVEDPAAAPRLRVAAAAALGASLDDRGRARLAELAGATVEPELRVALEAAAGDDDRELERALDEVDPEAARAGAHRAGRGSAQQRKPV